MILVRNELIVESINSDSIDYFLNIENLKYAGFFNRDVVQEMVSRNKSVRITYIGYLTSKLFNGKAINLKESETNCNSSLQISPHVISASKLPEFQSKDDLVTLIYEQTRVNYFLF